MRRLLWITVTCLPLSLALLLFSCQLLLGSERFVQGYLLPKVSELTGIKISAKKVAISLLNEIALEGIQLNCNPLESSCYTSAPLAISAAKLSVNYNLWGLISRKLEINSLSADAVHISIASSITPSKDQLSVGAKAQESELNHNLTADQEASSATLKPSFVVTTESVTIKNSSFRYLDALANQRYFADGITVAIPKANSNGDSELLLQARITADSSALTLSNELLRGSVVLRDAALFAPRQITISAQAGSASPTPLELNGTLNFSEVDRSLSSIEINRAILRQSLFQTLSIKNALFSEAEYELKGVYPIKQPAPIKLALRVHRAVAQSLADLKDSELIATLALKDGALIVEQGVIELIANNSRLARGALSGELGFDPFKTLSKLNIRFSEANFDGIEQLFKPSKTLSDNAATEPSKAPHAAEQKVRIHSGVSDSNQAPTGESASSLKLPLVEASLAVDKAIYQNLPISNLIAELTTTDVQTIKHGLVTATFDGAGKLSASVSGSLNSTVNIRANGDKINILPLAALAQGEGQLLEGTIDRLKLDLSLAPNNPRTTITGRSELSVSRVIVPSTLHSQVPFNILFLPFDALITVFGGTLNAVLPKSVSNISAGIREVLDDAGRLGIAKGTIDLDFNHGKISCNKFDIDTKNLPDFTVKGSVTATNSLDFTIFIGLLKLNLPLPVAGTLSAPLPDLVLLGPEIIRGLGLSLGNIASGVVSMVGGASQGASATTTEALKSP